MTKIICFIGVIGSGKSYQGEILVNNRYKEPRANKYTIVNFADEIYMQVGKILGIDLEDRANRKYFKLIYPDARQILQNYGNLRREEDSRYWVDKWADKVSDLRNENIVCPDVRFLNEVQVVLDFEQELDDMIDGVYKHWYDVDFVFCDYHSSRYQSDNPHESEKLAQRMLKDGLEDGDKISHKYLRGLIKDGI